MRSALHASWMCAVVALGLTSCAYYNTFYKAKSYYEKATLGAPYAVEKADPSAAANFGKSIDYSKKVIANYPKSKWVDDAYLLWAKALVGRDDPTQTMNMLGDFAARYPRSPLRDEARFYLGVAGRKSRKYDDALTALEEFLRRSPRHALAPYGYLEQARVLEALGRHAEAAAAAAQVLERYKRFPDRGRALVIRADALLAQGDHERARADYRTLGAQAVSDEDRFGYLLKEADCLESGRLYDPELALLKDALAHESEPLRAPVTTAPPGQAPAPGQPLLPGVQRPAFLPATPSNERWGRLTIRIGTVHLLAGRQDKALEAYRTVAEEFLQSPLASEAQYRVGLVFETVADDFDAARTEYGKVAKLSAASPYAAQASQRLVNLERLSQVRTGGGSDSLAKGAEASFMRAELYLFQNNKPERALEEYGRIAEQLPGTAWAGKALTAQAWVLRTKLDHPAQAESLLWVVVRDYPRTEAQLSARDYLEAAGRIVPDSLIQMPEPVFVPPDTSMKLTPPPPGLDSLGVRRVLTPESLGTLPLIRAGDPVAPPPGPDMRAPLPLPAPADTLFGPALADTLRTAAPADTARAPAPADSARTVPPPVSTPPDTTRKER